MKKIKILTSTITAVSLLSLTAVQSYANFVNLSVNANDISNAAGPDITIGHVIGFVVDAAVIFGILAALIYIVLGAFNWITSGGDKAKVDSARGHIVAAVIGLIIIFLTLVIINFVLQVLGIGTLTNLRINALRNAP